MFYATAEPHGLAHDPFKSLVAPRPIGWVSTLDAGGGVNLAPYSFFNGVASAPPIVMFAGNGAHIEGGRKDSVANAEDTGEFVCNVATWELREQMNATSAMLPREVDEFTVAGLTPAPSMLVAPPRVKESPVHLECRTIRSVTLPSADPAQPNVVIFGEVIGIHIADAILEEGMINMRAFRPIARLGYMDYTVVDNVFTMARPRARRPE